MKTRARNWKSTPDEERHHREGAGLEEERRARGEAESHLQGEAGCRRRDRAADAVVVPRRKDAQDVEREAEAEEEEGADRGERAADRAERRKRPRAEDKGDVEREVHRVPAQDGDERHAGPVQCLEEGRRDVVGADQRQREGEHARHPRRPRGEPGLLAGCEIDRLRELECEAEQPAEPEREEEATPPDARRRRVIAGPGLARDQHRHAKQDPDRHADQAVLDGLAEHVIGKLAGAGPSQNDHVGCEHRDDADTAQDHRPGEHEGPADVPAQRVLWKGIRRHGRALPEPRRRGNGLT
jgi:hypothetical protein